MSDLPENLAFDNAALYLDLFDQKSPNLVVNSPNIYRLFASELTKEAKIKSRRQYIKQVTVERCSALEIVEGEEIAERIASNRQQFYPELDRVMSRLLKQNA
jgi:hypothetical protein